MTFKATDTNGNVSDIYTINITVVDDIAPVFWVSLDFFSVEDSLQLTHEQIVAVLLAQNEIDSTQVVAYKVVEDDYTVNAFSAGKYAVSYQLQLASGKVMTLSTNINVIGEETVDTTVPTTEDDGFWASIENAFDKVVDFVKENWIACSIGAAAVLMLIVAIVVASNNKDDRKKYYGRR